MDSRNHDEITLRQVVQLLQSYISCLWSNKILIIAVALVVGLFFGVASYFKEVVYSAKLTYMVNEEEGNQVGGVSSILGQLGLGGGGGNQLNLDKIVALSRSRLMVNQILFDSLAIGGRNDLIANHILAIYDYDEALKADFNRYQFRFNSDKLDLDDRIQSSVAKMLYSKVSGDEKGRDGLVESTFNENTGIVRVNATTTDEELSVGLCRKLYEKVSNFYVEKSIEKQKLTYNLLSQKTDSIKNVLYLKEIKLAQRRDMDKNLFRQKDAVEASRISREIQMLNIVYLETLKNSEKAAFLLSNTTPVFQTIDVPVLPLAQSGKGVLKSAVIGGVLSGIILSLFLIFRMVIREALAE